MTSTTVRAPDDASLVPASAEFAALAEYGVCGNCGLALRGEYCSACGQRALRGRLNVPALAHQLASEVLDLDHGILFTALELTRRPGEAIRDYVRGRRARYTGPVKYFVLTVALTTFATTQLGVLDDVASGMFGHAGPGAADTARRASEFMSQWMTLFLSLGVPFTAALTHRFFRRAGLTYAEHMALNLYSYGHQSLGLALALLVGHVLRDLEWLLVLGWTFGSAAYFAWTCAGFFRERVRSAVPRALLSAGLGTLAYFLVVVVVLGFATEIGAR